MFLLPSQPRGKKDRLKRFHPCGHSPYPHAHFLQALNLPGAFREIAPDCRPGCSNCAGQQEEEKHNAEDQAQQREENRTSRPDVSERARGFNRHREREEQIAKKNPGKKEKTEQGEQKEYRKEAAFHGHPTAFHVCLPGDPPYISSHYPRGAPFSQA
jgi:hypothetical protein